MEFEKIRAIVSEVLQYPESEISEHSSFVDDLGADSLDIAQILMAVEDEFGVEILQEDAEDIVTVSDAVAKICKTMRE